MKILEKIDKKENELTKQLSGSNDAEIISIAYQLATLEEIRNIVEAEACDLELLERRLDRILKNLTSFGCSANFEISPEDFEYALN